MTKTTPSSYNQADIYTIKHFRARLTAQLIVVVISLTVFGQRVAAIIADHEMGSPLIKGLLISLPFQIALCLVVIAKYILYRIFGSRIFKYSCILDVIFCLVFTADWMVLINGQLHQSQSDGKYMYSITAVLGFTTVAWRTLVQILITQQWQFRGFPIICVFTYIMWFAVANEPAMTGFILSRGILIVLYIILIFYYEHKINFTMVMGSIQQQQWLQLNEFILDNIPENIAIMDLNGKSNFINENFRKLIRLHSGFDEINQFLKSVKKIKRQRHLETDSETNDSIIVSFQSDNILTFNRK